MPACDVDRVARDVIAKAGFGRYFGHGLGHGIGLEIHEAPRLLKTNQRPLKPGNVVTVEPGIYLPGWGGVRIEDDVLVTRTGCEVLTQLPQAVGRGGGVVDRLRNRKRMPCRVASACGFAVSSGA